jgi:ubiquinone/menaquinone biosynthesis C-methylase UbiE
MPKANSCAATKSVPFDQLAGGVCVLGIAIGELREGMIEPSSGYPLGYTEDEARRLAAQAAFFEDLTGDVFRRAGIGVGMHVLDLGCGVGDVSFLAAGMVGATGTVLGVDRNASSIETARNRAMGLGLSNVQFEVSELDTFDDAGRTFDALIGRLVLLYLPDPATTLRRFRNFLRPGGVIAFQEMDMDQRSQFPASELFTRVTSWIIAGFKAGGAEPNMGRRLLSTFLRAGLPRPKMIATSRVESGPDAYNYSYTTGVLRSLLPPMERAGLASAQEVAIDTLAARLRQDATANEIVMFLPRMVGAWSRLPS